MKNNPELALSAEQIDYLLSPKAIRERAAKVFAFTQAGQGAFEYHADKLKPTVEYVLKVIRKNYPSLEIPFHSRWGHFRAGQIDRVKDLDAKLASADKKEKARSKLDLVITSVLLDAGAGMQWKYKEASSGKEFSKSEGLGIASFYLFLSGAMGKKSLTADKDGLRALKAKHIEDSFQVSAENPLVGVEGRLKLLNNLASALENKKIFRDGRPGNILDYLEEKYGHEIPAQGVLRAVLDGLGPIWPGRLSARGINLGDVWVHPLLGNAGTFESLIPFHKLSQWMTYSLIEPIQEAGFTVSGVEGLTGLAEYRNGGLLLDSGLCSLRNPSEAQKTFTPDEPLILEWRALTVHLLDIIGAEVQKALGKTPQDFPLAKVLEGGTWWAGRFLAKEKRSDGGPPLQLKSDGTVF